MAAPLEAPLPLIKLYAGMIVRLEAFDPSTGAAVAGVTVGNVAIYGEGLDSSTVDTSELAVWLQPRER